MDPEAYDADFVEWLGAAKEAAKDRAREFLTEYGCLQRFNWLSARCAQERVMPFVGAGLSCSAGYPLWGDFLRSLTADYAASRPELDEHLAAWRYEEAAQLMLDRMGAAIFDEAVQSTFGHRRRILRSGSASALCVSAGGHNNEFRLCAERSLQHRGEPVQPRAGGHLSE